MTGAGESGGPVRASGLLLAETVLWYAAGALVAGTGLLYAWLRYVAAPVDPYAFAARPWQPLVQHLHVLAAPALVFAAGAIFRTHALATWRRGAAARRRSGLHLAVSMLLMIASGYLLQVSVEEGWRRFWGIAHTIVSLAWIAGVTAHLLARRRMVVPKD